MHIDNVRRAKLREKKNELYSNEQNSANPQYRDADHLRSLKLKDI